MGRPAAPSEPGGGSLLADPSFLTALVVAVVVAVGFGLVVPVLPLFAQRFGVGVFGATAVVSAFAGVRLVSDLYSGHLSDRLGARRAVGYGVLIVGASTLLVAYSPSYWWLLVFRGAGGFGSALFFTALLALVVGHVGPAQRGRALGLLQGAFLFGMTVGPFLGGALIAPLGLAGPFLVYAATCGIAGFVALTFLPRVPADAAPVERRGLVETWRVTRGLCASPAFVAALVMMAAVRWSATGVRFSLVPLFAANVVGLREGPVGYALGLAAVAQLLVVWPAGKAADTLGRRPVSIVAYLVFAAVAAVVGLAATPLSFFVVMALYGVATGLAAATPAAIVADVVPAEQTGLGVGVLNTAADLGSVVGPLVGGLLVDLGGFGWGFGAASALLFVAAGCAMRMGETLPAPRTLRPSRAS
jgi:MFS family permease